MADKLTPKQEQFAQKVLQGETQSDAYRFAYNAKNMSDKTIWEEASVVAANPKVAARLFEGQKAAQERNLVTVESITRELDESRALAIEQDLAGEMTKATMAKAKIHGLDVHKIDASVGFKVTISDDDAEL